MAAAATKTSCLVTGHGVKLYVNSFICVTLLILSQNIIAQDPNNHDTTFVPTIFESDKTTVSVATGQNEYYPFYMSNGLIHNNVRRAHRNGLTLIGFFAIPKSKSHNINRTFSLSY